MIWKSLTAAAAGIVALGGAWAVIDKYQPFAYADDLIEVAQVSYTAAINQRWDMLLTVQAHIEAARRRGDAPTVLALQQQEQRLKQEIDMMADRQRRFGVK